MMRNVLASYIDLTFNNIIFEENMRTTINIDDDILLAAKEIAQQRGVSIGEALSDLARRGFTRTIDENKRNGLPLFPIQPNAGVVTLELVNQLREDNG
jgi:antitoxin component of RelBE/YafQ-DinJ toxin-antitoxin module